MLRPDDPYNQGIGTPYLGDMNLGSRPVDNMQLAQGVNLNKFLEGDWSKEMLDKSQIKASGPINYDKAYGAIPSDITKGDFIRNALNKEYGTSGIGSSWVLENALSGAGWGKDSIVPNEVLDQFYGGMLNTNVPPTVKMNKETGKYEIDFDVNELDKDVYRDLQKKGFFPDDDQTSLDNDFYNEYGYPKTAGIGVLTGLKKIFGPKVGAYLFRTGKYKAQKEIGKKVKPIITGAITGGGAQAAPGGGQWVGGAPAYTHQGQGGGEYRDTQGNIDYHDPYDPGGGEARGGFIDGTNRRRSYFDGGLLSLWPR